MTSYFFEKAYLISGWQDDVLITVDDDGYITAVESGAKGQGRIKGFAFPAFPNSHSHAFQKTLAGRTEYKAKGQDNFWTWRDLMYQFAGAITPEDLKNIAAFLYMEMLKAGYGAVAEFHYLHHQPSGRPYDNPAEMSLAIRQAAQEAGIALTHLPVLYMQGGFDRAPLAENQLRFHHNVDSYLSLLEQLQGPDHNIGVAFHSLRAVPEEAMTEVIAAIDDKMPIHIHIAEQVKEVEDCLLHREQRPVDWLLSHQDVGPRWCLVHATHMTMVESDALAKSGAVVSLCPSTEANLGDGFFPLRDFLGHGGRISIGSDGNSLINPIEEIRWLEYGARLVHQQRNIAASKGNPHTGTALLNAIQKGGGQALGQKSGVLAVGQRADIAVLDGDGLLGEVPLPNILDALVFSGSGNDIKHVMVAGKWFVQDGYHPGQDEITTNYKKTVRRLRERP